MKPRKQDIDWTWHKQANAQASHWNGNQDRVFSAIKQGIANKCDIETYTGLDNEQVSNAIRRLIDANQVRRKFEGGYAPVATSCLLSEVWK